MMNPIFSFEEYGFDVNYPPQVSVDNSTIKPESLFSTQEMSNRGEGAIDHNMWSNHGFFTNYQQFSPEFMPMDDVHFSETSTTQPTIAVGNDHAKSLTNEIAEILLPKEKTHHTSFSSLDILKQYRKSFNSMNGDRTVSRVEKELLTTSGSGELSTEELMRVAAAQFIQLAAPGDSSVPFSLSLSGLTIDEIKNVELASFLLAAAEKVTNQQYDRASTLLRQCYMMSSNIGSPVQRVIYYFTDALQERIARETGRFSSKGPRGSGTMTAEEVIDAMLASHPLQLICHKTLPFNQVTQFTAIQSLLDSISTAKRIHMIDLSIRHGIQWTILIQALASRVACPVEYLKISAIGLAEKVNAATGERLSSYARSLGLAFEFKTVVLADMKDLKEDMFELSPGETVGIYSHSAMNSLIVKPESLENLMRVVWKVKPCIMTVIDVEAKHNSPSFITRFTEALFYFSALFDCVDSVMERTDVNRFALEGNFFSQGIRSMVATEGRERVVRHVGISVWREFFARFGLAETELNEYSAYQGSLLLKQFRAGDSCTIEKDGKSLLVGWKGTPMHFVSAWKFLKREGKV